MLRYPAVAGQFYPSSSAQLKSMLSNFCSPSGELLKAKAVVVPHAGYIYSGHIAGATYSRVEIPDNCVIMGPNHTGLGKRAAVYPKGAWATPLGEAFINEELTSELLQKFPYEEDTLAHLYEHSLEVQLPFLQFCKGESPLIVPIVFQHLSLQECLEAGENLAEVLEKTDSLIVISSDFSHYVPQEVARKLDGLAIEAILNLSPEALYERVHDYNITMCGIIPATVGLYAAKLLGANAAELVLYGTSGDVNGDYSQVVGYAGIVIY